uniref:IF rod domain-containing protein n=1 Tax=Monopterus albus TaxID=43700 RepID=A0A3Q3QH74_MONAL
NLLPKCIVSSLQVSSRIRVQSPSPSRCRGGRLGYRSTAIKLGTEINEHHANEKEEMQALIVRFAGYIVEVQALEQRNTALPAELTALHSRYKGSPTGIGEEYELKFKEVWELIEVLTNEKGAADIERGYLEEEVEVWRLKVEEELHIEQLVAEIELLKKLHDEEVAELRKQIEYSKMTAELDGDRPDLAVASRSVQEAEKWYKSKFDTLKEHAGKHEEHMKTMKDEITTFHNKVTELQSQIDALRDMDVKLLEEEEQSDSKVTTMSFLPNSWCKILQVKTGSNHSPKTVRATTLHYYIRLIVTVLSLQDSHHWG